LESGVYLSMQRFGEVITYGECCSYPRVVLIFIYFTSIAFLHN
jgi:hypothetical protein